MIVRQERFGHVNAKATMGYTHLITSDDVRVAEQLGALLDKNGLADGCSRGSASTTKLSLLSASEVDL
jgi:hypothetical protein